VDRFLVLRRHVGSPRAHLDRIVLEAAGIPAFVGTENPGERTGLESLYVRAADAERAEAALAEAAEDVAAIDPDELARQAMEAGSDPAPSAPTADASVAPPDAIAQAVAEAVGPPPEAARPGEAAPAGRSCPFCASADVRRAGGLLGRLFARSTREAWLPWLCRACGHRW
jgi:hypothetical protein